MAARPFPAALTARLSADSPAPVVLLGIVNTTPDSFSDGGHFFAADPAVEHALRLVAEGADLIDVGGESTRPGAAPVSVEEERRRIEPVVAALVARGVAVSIDTRHVEVARAALELGACLVNDISGLRDPAMRALAASHGVPAVLMHMPVDDPAVMQRHADYDDVVRDVASFLRTHAELALRDGVPAVIVDPGFGFGKTAAHNIELIRRLDELVALGYPVLVGASRKRTIGELTGVDRPSERVAGTLALHLAAVARGARLLRVHDVAAHRQALAVWDAVGGATRRTAAAELPDAGESR